MERIVIPGAATYVAVSLSDLMVGAPLASQILLGATAPGQVIAAASLTAYLGSAARDAWARRGVRPVDFQDAFGADVSTFEDQPRDARLWEIQLLGSALNEEYTDRVLRREQLAALVDEALTATIASITGQQIITSTEIRSHGMARLLMPSALGTCDPISGDVAIYQDLGPCAPHVIAHEFAHRKGYLKELHAQVLAYAAQRGSAHPVLVQAARLERLTRQLNVYQRHSPTPETAESLVDRAMLRPELRDVVLAMVPEPGERKWSATRSLYDKRMRVMGQNGLTDYDEGFTNVLWTFARSETATAPRIFGAL